MSDQKDAFLINGQAIKSLAFVIPLDSLEERGGYLIESTGCLYRSQVRPSGGRARKVIITARQEEDITLVMA